MLTRKPNVDSEIPNLIEPLLRLRSAVFNPWGDGPRIKVRHPSSVNVIDALLTVIKGDWPFSRDLYMDKWGGTCTPESRLP